MAMKLGIGLLGGLTALALSAPTAWGQDMDFSSGAQDEEGGDEASMDFSDSGAEEEAPAEEQTGAAPGEGEDLLGDIGGGEEPVEPDVGTGSEEQRPQLAPPEVWAVQRIFAMRNRRFELVPRFGISMNDQFVSHFAFGGMVNWYITDVLALGLEGNWFFENRETNINFYTARSFRVAIPINEYWMAWNLNFTYVPLYGKFAIFNQWIVHWDTFIVGGLGITLTRPIAVVDQQFRDFEKMSYWGTNITANIGLGARVFLTKWIAIMAELRAYGFPQSLESRSVAPLSDCEQRQGCDETTWDYQRANPDTWLDPKKEFAINVMVQVGLSLFLPPTFEYRLPL